MKTLTRHVARLSILAIAVFAALTVATSSASAAYDPGDPVQKAEYDATIDLAVQGYEYGMPVLNMQRTFRTSTSVNVPNGRGGGPVNAFSHFTKLADAKDRTVVIPNSDTLYSMAWLDLRNGPMVVHTKPTKRFHVLELVEPWQENFANIGSPDHSFKDGDYLVVKKGWKGKVPKGLTKITAPYDRVWIIGRTIIYGQKDLKNVRKVQKTYRITPLKRWNPKKPYAYSRPKPDKVDRRIHQFQVPGTQPGEDAATFFDALGNQLKRFPPRKPDAPMLKQLKTLGIGPGLHPVADGTLSDAQLQAMRDAVSGGPASLTSALLARYLSTFDAQNGWLSTETGTYGTDYRARALVDKFGLGAPRSWVSVYPMALMDRTKAFLTGAKNYVAHFTPETAHPPVKFFWSMTMYDNDGFLVDNVDDRYLINDRSNPKYNPDGSLDIYVQPNRPTDPAKARNWLPSPPETSATRGFRIMMRLYGLSDKGIKGVTTGKGWQAPAILPCGIDGKTSTGIVCPE
ncbi:MAG: DUF1254 domain-containing protein [Solirubrobacterales bacterium]